MAVQVHTLLEETSIQWHSIQDEFSTEAYGLGEAYGQIQILENT